MLGVRECEDVDVKGAFVRLSGDDKLLARNVIGGVARDDFEDGEEIRDFVRLNSDVFPLAGGVLLRGVLPPSPLAL